MSVFAALIFSISGCAWQWYMTYTCFKLIKLECYEEYYFILLLCFILPGCFSEDAPRLMPAPVE